MQESSREQHGDEHRVLSPSSNSTRNVDRLCEPIALPSGSALVRSAPDSELRAGLPSPPTALPNAATSSRPLSSADLRLVRDPPGLDHPGRTVVEVTSRWRDIAPDDWKRAVAEAANSKTDQPADAGSSGAVRRAASPPSDGGVVPGAVRRVSA